MVMTFVSDSGDEFRILTPSLHTHPNVLNVIHSFKAKPIDEMIQRVAKGIRDTCFDGRGNILPT
eukprot:CAMPEP_0117067910 /NCGR_PEP_ID=MMETSP0472-20121206/47555_1 /TAXON_ID=693140 ORGANISM="Tiarina fusus, Strain LIS" /NCGR_SAMPLE_ID=MMETSP0472 /ASSEMBLY_ACC=CAM_ASM_000603 /LENGTH=63 /DNA_ID=CAMNT_0004789681 /DNA_START=408 /DNA_END=596 /DNA_ORIENTATION=+